MTTEEKDEQPRPRKVIPSIKRDYDDSGSYERQERRPYHSGNTHNRYSSGNREEGYSSYNRPSFPRGSSRPRMSDSRDNNYQRSSYDRHEGSGEHREYRSGGYRDYGDQGYNQPRSSEYTPHNQGDDKPTRRKRPRVGESARITPFQGNRGERSERPYENRSEGYREERRYNNDYRSQDRDRSYGNDHRSSSRDRGGYNNDYRSSDRGGYNRDRGYNSDYRSSDRSRGYNNDYRSHDRDNRDSRDRGYNSYPRRQPSQGSYDKKREQIKRRFEFPTPVKYKEVVKDPNEPIRLNKFLANAGVSSRREADELIKSGAIKVNGEVITELGTKITRLDQVTYNDNPVQIESKIYILLNKPKNFVTTAEDPQDRRTVMDLVKNACSERIYPVGRLDRNTTGVLLLTNDGDLASKLTHPSYMKKKIYHVWLDKSVTMEDMERLATGIELEDGEVHADAISYVTEDDKSQIGIEIHSGRNRIVRRMFEALGYHVTKLDRVYFAGLTKKNLSRGRWRYLTEMEVNALRMGAFE